MYCIARLYSSKGNLEKLYRIACALETAGIEHIWMMHVSAPPLAPQCSHHLPSLLRNSLTYPRSRLRGAPTSRRRAATASRRARRRTTCTRRSSGSRAATERSQVPGRSPAGAAAGEKISSPRLRTNGAAGARSEASDEREGVMRARGDGCRAQTVARGERTSEAASE